METSNPRPKKPWYRPRNVVLAAVGLVVFLVGREVYLAFTAVPGSRVNYAAKMAELLESYQPVPVDTPGAVDGWPILLQAIEVERSTRAILVPGYPRSRVTLDYTAIGGPPPDAPRDGAGMPLYIGDETWAEVEARARRGMRLLEERGLFEYFARLAAAPRAARPVRPDGQGRLIGMMLPELSPMRHFARIERARMTVAAEEGDWEEFARAYEEGLALASIAAHQGFQIDYLVGLAMEALTLQESRYALIERPSHPPDAGVLRRLLAAMDRRPLPPPDLPIKAERIALDDSIQWSHTDNGRGSGRLLYSEIVRYVPTSGAGGSAGVLGAISTSRLGNVAGVFFASKGDTIRKADQLTEIVLRLAPMSGPQRAASGQGPDVFVEGLSPRFMFLRVMRPAFGRLLRSTDQNRVLRAGTRLMLAVELFRAEQGRYPATLDELVPSVVPSIPEDHVSGKPWGYRVLEEPDEFGRAYLLYSLGSDAQDDGARRMRSQPLRALHFPPNAGFDFVINDPRHVPEPQPTDDEPEEPSQPPEEAPSTQPPP